MAEAQDGPGLPRGPRLTDTDTDTDTGAPPDGAFLYDWECRHVLRRSDQDFAFWRQQARRGGAVLELACGTGRLTVALAEVGVEVVGIDNDPVMLAAARRRLLSGNTPAPMPPRPPVFIAADMRRFAFARPFRLVFVGYNSLQLLTAPGEMAACLSRARQHLTPDGLVGVEVTDFQVGGADGPDESDRLIDGPPLLPLADVDGIRLSGALVHDLARRTSRYRRHFAGEGWIVDSDIVVRSLNRRELETVFAQAGLTATRWWIEGTTTRAVARATR